MNIADVKQIGIVGAGMMGSGIAGIFAEVGYEVKWYNRSEAGMQRGLDGLRSNQATLIQNGVLTQTQADAAWTRISPTHDLENLASVDFISESIAENLQTKVEFFRKLDRICAPTVVFTTNTSGLSISQIAKAVSHPERFAGMHYINPPYIIPLVELIKGENTSNATLDFLVDLARRIRKHPVLVQEDLPGFIGNRIQFAVIREALHLVEAGVASPGDIDTVIKHGLGLRWALLGPLEIADLGGLDVFSTIGGYLLNTLSNAEDSPQVLQDLVAEGKLGAKSGSGFYDYSSGKLQQIIEDRDKKLLEILKIKAD